MMKKEGNSVFDSKKVHTRIQAGSNQAAGIWEVVESGGSGAVAGLKGFAEVEAAIPTRI